jgi:hypothetical protein
MVRAATARKETAEDLGREPRRITRLLAGLDPTSFVDRGPGMNGATAAADPADRAVAGP